MNHEKICDLAFFCSFLSKVAYMLNKVFSCKETINAMYASQKFGGA